ncbi:MAG: hypothetical protein RIF41_26350 [Polyangiaceae bacterium]
MTPKLGALMAIAGLLSAGCAELTPFSPPGSGGGGHGGAGGSGAGAGAEGGFTGETITVNVVTEEAIQSTPVPGVEICLLDVALPCVTTDAMGEGSIEVPADAAVWASLVLDGYVPVLVGAVTETEDLDLTAPMINDQLAITIASLAQTEFDPRQGHLALVSVRHPVPPSSSNPPQPGVTFALEPATGVGPVYAGPGNIPDTTLTETGEAGGAIWFNVDPGEPVLTATHPTEPCEDFLAHPGTQPDTYDLRVQAGFLTLATVICGEEPMGTGGGGAGGMGAGGAGVGGTGGAGGMAAGGADAGGSGGS